MATATFTRTNTTTCYIQVNSSSTVCDAFDCRLLGEKESGHIEIHTNTHAHIEENKIETTTDMNTQRRRAA